MQERDVLVIGGGPAGAAAAIRAARAGLRVTVFEKGPHGRDKVCGDGLTPRAVAALNALDIDMTLAHRIDGLRMIAGWCQRDCAGRPAGCSCSAVPGAGGLRTVGDPPPQVGFMGHYVPRLIRPEQQTLF